MTREEALEKLNAYMACESKKAHFDCEDECDDNCHLLYEMGTVGEHNEAINVAIKALEQELKTGHWVEENINEWSRKVFCSECGCPPPFEHVSNGDIYSAGGYGVINKTKFCPSCGAKMEDQK